MQGSAIYLKHGSHREWEKFLKFGYFPAHLNLFNQENAMNYDKGVLAEILEPIMGKGLIPADLETWKVWG